MNKRSPLRDDFCSMLYFVSRLLIFRPRLNGGAKCVMVIVGRGMILMKTLILYATKYGAAREIAERIKRQLPDAEVCDLQSGTEIPLESYDAIVVGTSLYAGMARKEAKEFVGAHESELMKKTLGIFLSGIAEGDAENDYTANFPQGIVEHAKVKALLGGIFDPQKTNFFEKLIMKLVAKTSEYKNTISDEKIKAFAEGLLK